jgi:hypothetical protein
MIVGFIALAGVVQVGLPHSDMAILASLAFLLGVLGLCGGI